MRRGTYTLAKGLSAAAAVLVAASALADPGNGIRLGGADARLHPFFDLESRYDSNVTYTGTNPVGDLILHFKPGLEVNAPGDAAALEFKGVIDWAQYLGVQQADTKSLSRLYAFAAMGAAFNHGGAVAPRIDNNFERAVSTASVSSVAAPVVSDMNKLALSVPIRPGGGALEASVNGSWIVQSYENYLTNSPTSVQNLAYQQYGGGAEFKWRFFPRTAAVLDANYFQRKPNSLNQPDDANGLSALVGLTGLLSERIAATAKVGYGTTSAAAFTSPFTGTLFAAKTATSPLADLAVEWIPVDALSLRVGYMRQMGVDPYASTYDQDSVNGTVQAKFADRFAFKVRASWDRFNFVSMSGYTNTFLVLDPSLEAKFGKWLTGALGYTYSARTVNNPPASLGVQNEPPSYNKDEIYLRIGVTY